MFCASLKKICIGQAGVSKANSSYNKCAHMENITGTLVSRGTFSSRHIFLLGVLWNFQKAPLDWNCVKCY